MIKKLIVGFVFFSFQIVAYAETDDFITAFGINSADTYQNLSKFIQFEKNQHHYETVDIYSSQAVPFRYDINVYTYLYAFSKQGKICRLMGMGESLNGEKIKAKLLKKYGQPFTNKKGNLEWQLADDDNLKNIELIYYKQHAIGLMFNFNNDQCPTTEQL